MGEIVLAAKCTHVPTMLMSEQDGPVKGKRKAAIDGHVEIASRARALGADTAVELQGRPENVTFSMPRELRLTPVD